MIEKTVTVKNDAGVHLSPSLMIVKTAEKFRSEVKISRNEIEVDAKSIMALLMLEAAKGSVLTIKCNGPDEEEAINKIFDLIDSGFAQVTTA